MPFGLNGQLANHDQLNVGRLVNGREDSDDAERQQGVGLSHLLIKRDLLWFQFFLTLTGYENYSRGGGKCTG